MACPTVIENVFVPAVGEVLVLVYTTSCTAAISSVYGTKLAPVLLSSVNTAVVGFQELIILGCVPVSESSSSPFSYPADICMYIASVPVSSTSVIENEVTI